MTDNMSIIKINSTFYAITPKLQLVYPHEDSDFTSYDLKIQVMSYCLVVFSIALFIALLYYSNKKRLSSDDLRSVGSFVDKIKLEVDSVNSRDISKSSSFNTKEATQK